MMKKLLIFLIVSTGLFLAGCPASPDSQNRAAKNTNQTATTFGGAYRVEFSAAPVEVTAGEPVQLVFTVKNDRGEIFRDLEIVHEKPMHLIIVSEDLSEFYHEHPEFQADGSLRANFTFPTGGKFRLYTDFKPKGASPNVQNFPLQVAGEPRAATELKADAAPEQIVDGLKFVLKPDGRLEAGEETTLNFSVSDAPTGAKITDLENYLGEKAHIVIISRDLKEFVHAHQMSAETAKQDEHRHDANAAKDEKMMMNPPPDATVAAHVAFPKAGLYKIWAQFQRRGKILTVPFVVEVKPAAEEKSAVEDYKIPDGAIKIVAGRDGFIPQEITRKKGQPVKLAFVRTEAAGCGDEIVLKELDLRKALPVGKVVLIEIPENKTGEINFSCGQQTAGGKIIIQP